MVMHKSTPSPWNIHYLNLARSPALDSTQLKWLNSHLMLSLSDREQASIETLTRPQRGLLTNLKCAINRILQLVGHGGNNRHRLFKVRNANTGHVIILIVDCLRLDTPSHTVVADTCVVPLTHATLRLDGVQRTMRRISVQNSIGLVSVDDAQMKAWWQLLPVLAERCRDWAHSESCEYRIKGVLHDDSPDMERSPLCSCGLGKGLPASVADGDWRDMAPLMTRIALSPLFPMAYLETIGTKLRERIKAVVDGKKPDVCLVCGGPGKPQMMQCSGCVRAKYCSMECQREDWKTHKIVCAKLKGHA